MYVLVTSFDRMKDVWLQILDYLKKGRSLHTNEDSENLIGILVFWGHLCLFLFT